MPFNNDIAGGNGQLVRNWIQSQNFVAGTSGWRISKNGNAEFNNGTFRGSIEVGPLTGQHFIVNNISTGDVIDVYDSLNRLVMKVDNAGNVTTIDPVSLDESSMFGHGLQWENLTNPAFSLPNLYAQGNSVNGNTVHITSGTATNAGWLASLTLNDTKANTGSGANVVIDQGGTNGAGANSILGTVVQTDSALTGGNFIHVGTYTFTTNGVGNATFNHGCGFTPTQGWLAPMLAGGAGWSQYAWFTTPFNATQASAAFWNNLGATVNTTTLEAFGLFIR